MPSIAVRTGLVWPRVDPRSFAELPFRRPTTVVADTSGVIQGGLHFVADHLFPMARLKIPAVLHMEVINQADRFLKTRRTEPVRREVLLLEHLRSQTGQRVLLRLELREDTEIERNPLIGDPLRSAFKEDRDPELRDLNLSVPLKSYVDRMILESARQHQSLSSPGHPVFLLTSDQGLAKMSLAEGVRPLFFRAGSEDQMFGRVLTGALLSPFTGRLTSRSLPLLLWELATAFGRVRLERDSDLYVQIVAIDKALGWSSYHSIDDLLWLTSSNLPDWPPSGSRPPSPNLEDFLEAPGTISPEPGPETPRSSAPATVRASTGQKKDRRRGAERPKAAKLSDTNRAGVAFYRMSANGLVRLVDQLASQPRLTNDDVANAIAARHPTAIAEYRRFLLSGRLIEDDKEDWVATDEALALAAAQRESDLERVRTILERTPSFARFVVLLRDGQNQGPFQSPLPPRVTPTYLALGEITALGANIPSEGYYPTTCKPTVAEFARLALERYAKLEPVNGWVGVGEWLEALIRDDGVHPIVARDNLQEADAANLLRRSTEGSTTDTRHDDHTLRVLRTSNSGVGVETVHLYRGDFLIPGKSSSSLRLEVVPS